MISPGKIELLKDRMKVIEEWLTPKSVSELNTFLEFTGTYRKFIKDYAKPTVSLNELLKRNVKWQ